MKAFVFIVCATMFSIVGCGQNPQNQGKQTNKDNMNYRKLTPEEERVIVNKGTEAPFTGKYNSFFDEGTYVCKRCGASLYLSNDKFKSECGWPSFDDEIKGAITRIPDADGIRTEIRCAPAPALRRGLLVRVLDRGLDVHPGRVVEAAGPAHVLERERARDGARLGVVLLAGGLDLGGVGERLCLLLRAARALLRLLLAQLRDGLPVLGDGVGEARQVGRAWDHVANIL